LIFGNGFFKPNMSTQVGRLYPAGDGRLDGAYTIFYMGINLGAFASPIVCGWLADNTVGSYHSGFTMAGIGMVVGLLIYLAGQPFVREIAQDVPAETATPEAAAHGAALTEAQAARQPSVLGGFSTLLPGLLVAIGIVLLVAAPACFLTKRLDFWDATMLGIAGISMMIFAYVCAQVHSGVRDRVFAILVLGVFVVFFWAAYEQAGNVLNLWADQQTNRYLTEAAPPPSVIPEISEEEQQSGAKEAEHAPATNGYGGRFIRLFTNLVTLKHHADDGRVAKLGWTDWLLNSFNPVPTAWFLSINAVAIVLLAPVFAWLWIALDRRGWQPSIPLKMSLGLFLMSASMAVMMGAANGEFGRSVVPYAEKLPAGIELTDKGELASKVGDSLERYHAGRLKYDAAGKQIVIDGILEETTRDTLIQATAPVGYRKAVQELQKKSAEIDGDKIHSVEVDLGTLPSGFDMKFAGIPKSVVHVQGTKLIAQKPLAEKEVKGLLSAGGEPTFRDSIDELFVKSTTFRVSSWWLFWSYILATLGELCLSPVGLSMVSKLAPAKSSTMLMGVWLLTSAFGNFAAGLLGEKLWGTVPPFDFFLLSTAIVGGAGVVLFLLCRLVVATMHGVK
jgi:dipeptide/tripeptide permease